MFSSPKWEYVERTKTLIVIRDGFKDMNFADRYLWVIQRRNGDKNVQVVAVTGEEYEKLKERIDVLR